MSLERRVTTVHFFWTFFKDLRSTEGGKLLTLEFIFSRWRPTISFTMRQNECRFRGRVNSSTLHFPFLDDAHSHSLFRSRVRLKYFKHATTVSECTLCRADSVLESLSAINIRRMQLEESCVTVGRKVSVPVSLYAYFAGKWLVLLYDSVLFIHLKIQINFTSRIFFHIDAQIIVIIFI